MVLSIIRGITRGFAYIAQKGNKSGRIAKEKWSCPTST